jgi:CubicO group peptidase (beta-lactamase class C family)
MTRAIALSLSLLVAYLPPSAQPLSAPKPSLQGLSLARPSPYAAIERLEADIPALMERSDVPGMSVALIRNGKLLWTHGFGVMNADTKQPVTTETIFEANSLSKPLFAYAVLTLVDEGRLNLDLPVTKYLGKPDTSIDDPRINLITARMLLSHTSGIGYSGPEGSEKLGVAFTPGEKWQYSPTGISYLAKVVEKITNRKIEDFVRQAVLQPLGMNNSSYIWLDRYDTSGAYRHDWQGQPVSDRYKWSRGAACCSLETTAADYALFVIAVMKRQLLKPATWEEMLKPVINVNGNSPQVFWGLGWGLELTEEGESFWHWGDGGNSKAWITAFLPKKDAIIFFSNSANGLFFTKEIIDDAIGGDHPAPAYLGYQRYDSPSWILLNNILSKGAAAALKVYTEQRGENKENGLTESQMNTIGYRLLTAKKITDAVAVFRQNTTDFPGSGNVWDSLAEAEKLLTPAP